MVDLVHRSRVWCSPNSPGAKGFSYWFNSIDEASWGLNVCPLRVQDAARSGSDHVYRKGRTCLLFWSKVLNLIIINNMSQLGTHFRYTGLKPHYLLIM